MNSLSEISPDDLPKNWHSTSIAVKITAVVVWGVMPIAFDLTIPLLSSIEEEIGKDNLWSLEKVHRFINEQLDSNPDLNSERLRDKLIDLKNNSGFSYLRLDYQASGLEQNQILIGKKLPEASIYRHDYNKMLHEHLYQFELLLHFPSLERGIELERMKYGSLIVIFTIILGLYLVYVIRNTLHSPFQKVIDATQSVINGNLETRLDINSDDEFGHLSGFFNHMIKKLSDQQQSLTEANKYLESLVQNKEMALAESRSKSLFLANMSHEIRTPMTAILGYAESLYRFGIQDKGEQQEALETIYRNSKHLINIINDILDLSKIEADKLQVETIPFSPIKLLNEVEQLMSLQAKEKGIQLNFVYDYPLPDEIKNDPTRFKQVLFNLIANAIRFTDQGAVTVALSCSFVEQLMHISVADNGIGLSEEQIKHLFQPYVQAKASTARQFGGTGLGLMIARRLVTLMGGQIQVTSTIGQGATFQFDITTGDISHIKPVTDVKISGLLPVDDINAIPEMSGEVLLVEDIVDNQKLISMYLRQAGLTVAIANNGKEGVSKAMNHAYNLILMDIQMPVMDGLTATRRLRELGYDGVIFALTANVLKNERDNYLQAGCNGILSKPIIVDEFYSTIRHGLKLKASKAKTIIAPENEDRPLAGRDSISGGNQKESKDSMFESLVKQFLESLRLEVATMDALIEHQDWAKLQNMFHNIKGRGGSFGFPELTHLAADLEGLLKNQKYDEFKGRFIDFEKYYRTILINE